MEGDGVGRIVLYMGCMGSEVRIFSPRPLDSRSYSASCIETQYCILYVCIISVLGFSVYITYDFRCRMPMSVIGLLC